MLPMLQQQQQQQQQRQQQRQHLDTQNNNNNNNSNSRSINFVTNQKRANMIFHIEQLLPTATITTITTTSTCTQSGQTSQQTATKCTKMINSSTKRIGGVYMAQFTPKDTISNSIPSAALMSFNGNELEEQNKQAFCELSDTRSLLNMTPILLRKIKLSEDIYSYNALFELKDGQVRVRLVRDIARDDELVAWFGEELSLLMAIPFLKPLNIQSNNRYTCHMCHLTFETPHPLKIHLALGCGRNSMDILWIRLYYALKATYNRTQSLAILPPSMTEHSPSTTASISPTGSPQHESSNSPQRLSAFRPILGVNSLATRFPLTATPAHTITLPLHTTAPSTTSTTTLTQTLSYIPSISTPNLTMANLLQPPIATNTMNAAAQIEAIVSNMGASKQGHLCIYCGKMYSRKYGLKIHIRTHTGFKPLKCKFCLRPFGDPSNLNKHVRLHLQSNNASSIATSDGFQCHLCHKSLARRRDLQRHIETRHSNVVADQHGEEDKHT